MGWENKPVMDWEVGDVRCWMEHAGLGHLSFQVCTENIVDGRTLMMMQEEDVRRPPLELKTLGDIKRFMFKVNGLRGRQSVHNQKDRISLGLSQSFNAENLSQNLSRGSTSTDDSESELSSPPPYINGHIPVYSADGVNHTNLPVCSTCSVQLRANNKTNISRRLAPERSKTFLAMTYGLCVSWLTAFTMTIVHDRVPDMNKYPPLPDLLLDNIPHIDWAFDMSEITGMTLLLIWLVVLCFHKHRWILARRFFSIAGTIYLLRCVTMLITSLSVPGIHLDCKPSPYATWPKRLHAAYVIWSGAGLSLQGVRTCGDYIFSGHTVSLTLLNFFITEYTSRRIYFLHTFTWVCNCFGVFFILAAHEHYSIDVFIAFYISSRLFLYYHTLVNNRALFKSHQGLDAKRTWFYFPLFSFFEQNIDGRIPNEFALPIHFSDIQDFADRFSSKFAEMSETRRRRDRVKSN